MHVIVFSISRRVRDAFSAAFTGKGANNLSFAGWMSLRRLVPALQEPTLCYLDLSSVPEGKLNGALRLLARNPNLSYGLIDPKGELTDPSRAFHDGAADYLNGAALRAGIDCKRLARVWAYSRKMRADAASQAVGTASGAVYLPSGSDWSQVYTGREYTFCLLFIELDGKEEMERKYGMGNLNIALSSFRTFIENSVKPFFGRLWYWSSFGGIVLFPFNGKDCPPISCLFRLVLFRHLYDIEGSWFPNFLSYRLVLHIGNLVYSDRNVGSVLSESLNSVFHLGQQFARPGGFYLTDDALRLGPPALRPYFLEAGVFEGRKIHRMRLPVHRKG